MSENDNTVNIKNEARRYHHGDLRAALIGAGLEELQTKAPEEVSLREIARKAGVSATAVYRHFPDKAALLGALCLIGGEKMSAAFREAMSGASNPKEAFEAMGRAYVRFALANPSLFRMLMTHKLEEGTPWNARLDALDRALSGLLPEKASDEQRRVRQLQAWALVHGLAMLMLDGQVPADEALIDQAVRAYFV